MLLSPFFDTCLYIPREEQSEGSQWEDGREEKGSPGIFLGSSRAHNPWRINTAQVFKTQPL